MPVLVLTVRQVATNGAGDVISTITSGVNSAATEATGAAGSVLSSATGTTDTDSGAMITPAPILAGGLLGAGMAVVALL